MKIVVLSKQKAKDFVSDVPWAAISISTYGDWPELNKCQQLGLLQLAYADAESQEMIDDINNAFPNDPPIRLFTEKDAEDILNFYLSVKDKIEVLLVHCEAGICRSSATAAAIALTFEGSDKEFFQAPFRPNSKVYRTILNKSVDLGLMNL